MPSNHLIFCRSLLLLLQILPSIRVFSRGSTLLMRWPKHWSYSFNISPSNEHPGLISFRMDWLDLLAVQGTLKSLLQHHSSEASMIQCSAFFTIQLSHPYSINKNCQVVNMNDFNVLGWGTWQLPYSSCKMLQSRPVFLGVGTLFFLVYGSFQCYCAQVGEF